MTRNNNTRPNPASRTTVTRRKFVNSSLAAAALPLLPAGGRLGPRTASANSQPGDVKRRIRLGVVGCGGRGAWITRLFQKHGGYDIFAIGDYFQEVADARGQALGVDRNRRFSGLSSYKKVLDSGVEAVALETPPYCFPEHARAAVDAGIHVFMAKPVAVDVPGCLEIEAAAGKATAKGLCFLVDYQIPTDPHNVEIVRRIHSGEIGRPAILHSYYLAGAFPDPARTATCESRLQRLIWCNDVAIGGGYHVNACIHAVDAGLWVADERPISAMGASRIGRADPHGDSHDAFGIVYEFANGLILNHRAKHLHNHSDGFRCGCEVHGDTGFAEIAYGGKAELRREKEPYSGEVVKLYEAGAERNIATFYTNVVEGDARNPTVRRAVDGALTTILGREASLRRSKLTWRELLNENRHLDLDLTGLTA